MYLMRMPPDVNLASLKAVFWKSCDVKYQSNRENEVRCKECPQSFLNVVLTHSTVETDPMKEGDDTVKSQDKIDFQVDSNFIHKHNAIEKGSSAK